MNKITYEERAQVYAEALATFGIQAQLLKAQEELTEVQLEICRALDGRAIALHLAEEVADATIVLEQIRQMFGLNEDVCRIMDDKVERLRHRIEKEKERRAAIRSLMDHGLILKEGTINAEV